MLIFMEKKSSLIIYKASAGSGKTYALAKEYLKIVIQNPYDYKRILAVTFTKKATAEMKSRIVEYLILLEKKSDTVDTLRNSIIDEIKEANGIDVSAVFDKHTRIALQLILHDYSHFNVSTIDSFFQSIIRAYAKELDLPIGMEVELDTASVIEEAIQAVLKEYKTDNDTFSSWIEAYIFEKIDDDKGWNIEKNIASLAKELLNEDYRLLTEDRQQSFSIDNYKETRLALKKIVANYRQAMDDLVQNFEQEIERQAIDLRLFKGKSTFVSFVSKIKNDAPEFTDTILNMMASDEVLSKETAKDSVLKITMETAWHNTVKPFLLAIANLIENKSKQYHAAIIVLKNIYSLALLEMINEKIKAYKQENNLILISDTNQIVSLIARHEDVPFIFEKSASFLKYILIDEFQDTSTLQWHGLLPLLLEILQSTEGLVLIVGDPKQSIYRWRGGKMELMIDGISSAFTDYLEPKNQKTLSVNYRSAQEIVDFNNAFFSTLKNIIPLDNPYFERVLADVEQKAKKTKIKGYVRCQWLDPIKGEDVCLPAILAIIKEVTAYKKHSDIAILVRTNIQGNVVANYLQEQGVPVMSAESLLLNGQANIALLLSALTYILHSDEDFYVIQFNYLLAQYLQKPSLENYLQKQNKQYFFENEFPLFQRKNTSTLRSISINELVFQVAQALQFDTQLDEYLLRFQDVAHQFAQQRSTSLSDFINYWNENEDKLSILPPEGIDAVNIMTIHKSKGLQFPIVIMPYANQELKPKSESLIWINSDEKPFNKLNAFPVNLTSKTKDSLFEAEYLKEFSATYLDNINILYVAFTRAEEQLYVLADASKSDSKDKSPLPNFMNKLIHKVVQSMHLENAQFEANCFTYGTVNTNKQAPEEINTTAYLSPQHFTDFKTKVPLAITTSYNEAQEKGTKMHEVLAKIKQKNQWKNAIASTVTDDDGYYAQQTQLVLQFFEKQQWFDEKWQHINERSFTFNGEFMRADKILLSADSCIIIDYKTGAKENTHIHQLQNYKAAYATFVPQKVSAFLLYIDTLELQEI